MPKRFELLVVDLDGTLVNSQALLVGLVNDTLVAQGLPATDGRLIATAIGLPLDEVFRRALPRGSAATIDELCARYRRRADTQEFVRQFRLFAGVVSTLAHLRRDGLRLVIGTSKGRATSLDILTHCGIADMIDEVIGGDSVARGKPHPEMVEQARRLFTAPAERTLVVGDTTFDMEMGKAAGVATCAVTYGMHTLEALRALRPDFLIDRFEALRDVLASKVDS